MNTSLISLLSAIGLIISFEALAIEVQGHRGARAVYYENSLRSHEEAISLGVHTVETDLHLTNDGHFVLHHDPIIDTERCSSASTQKTIIYQMTLEEVRSYECGLKKDGQDFPQNLTKESIATLDELEQLLLKHPQVKLSVELKYLDGYAQMNFPGFSAKDLYPAKEKIVEAFLQRILNHQNLKDETLAHRLTIQSFDQDILRKTKEIKNAHDLLRPIQLSYLYRGNFDPNSELRFIARLKGDRSCKSYCWVPNWSEARKFVEENKIDIFSPNISQINYIGYRSNYRLIFGTEVSRDFKIIAWTVNDLEDLETVKKHAIDGIITDNPKLFLTQ